MASAHAYFVDPVTMRNINQMAGTIERSLAEVQRSDAVRRELVANVCHDLSGPLTTMDGNGASTLTLVDDGTNGVCALDVNTATVTYTPDAAFLGGLLPLAFSPARSARISSRHRRPVLTGS